LWPAINEHEAEIKPLLEKGAELETKHDNTLGRAAETRHKAGNLTVGNTGWILVGSLHIPTREEPG